MLKARNWWQRDMAWSLETGDWRLERNMGPDKTLEQALTGKHALVWPWPAGKQSGKHGHGYVDMGPVEATNLPDT